MSDLCSRVSDCLGERGHDYDCQTVTKLRRLQCRVVELEAAINAVWAAVEATDRLVKPDEVSSAIYRLMRVMPAPSASEEAQDQVNVLLKENERVPTTKTRLERRARLDAEGTAEPLTEIVAVMPESAIGEEGKTVHVGQATHYVAQPRSSEAGPNAYLVSREAYEAEQRDEAWRARDQQRPNEAPARSSVAQRIADWIREGADATVIRDDSRDNISTKTCGPLADDILFRFGSQRDEPRTDKAPPQPCQCCEQAGELNVACVRYEKALTKLNEIRNSIVGVQGFNFSEHAYPMVAALDEAGFEGRPYSEARANVGTLLERANKAEARVAELEAQRPETAEPDPRDVAVALARLLIADVLREGFLARGNPLVKDLHEVLQAVPTGSEA